MNMSILKIISDSDCHLYIDLEPRCDIKANTLCKLSLNKGTYIIDCIHINQIDRVSLDYNIEEEDTEYLLRISLNDVYLARINKYRKLQGLPFVHNNLKCAQKISTQLYGIIDNEYNEVISCRYNGVRFCGDYICVSMDNKCGVIDLQNNEIIPIQYDEIDFRYSDTGIFLLKKGTDWGAKSIKGFDIPCIYYELIDYDRTMSRIYAKNKDGHCGIVDLNNNIIIPFVYSEIENDNLCHDYYIVKNTNNQYGVIDKKTGNPIIPCCYSFLKAENGAYKVCYNNEWGKLTNQGERIIEISRYDIKNTLYTENYIIPSKYDWCDRNHIDENDDQTIIVEANKKYGLIHIADKTEILPCIYDYLGYATKEGIIPCALNGQWGSILKTGQFISKLSYHESKQIDNNRFIVKIWGPRCGNSYGIFAILDNNGNEISSPRYYEEISDYDSSGIAWVKIQGKWGGIDTNGKDFIPFQYEDIKYPSEGLLAAKKQGKWGYINMQGEVVLPFQYDYACAFGNNGIAEVTIRTTKCLIDKCGNFIVHKNDSNVWLRVIGDYDIVYDFHDNFALACKNGLWGIIDDKGAIIIPFEYEEMFYPSTDLIRCKKNGLWGFIDKQGDIVISFTYEYASEYHEGLSACMKNNLWGYIDKHGKTIIPFIFKWASSFCNGYARIAEIVKHSHEYEVEIITSKNILENSIGIIDEFEYRQYGFINKQGQTIIQPQYNSVSDFSKDGIATVYPHAIENREGEVVGFGAEETPFDINTNNEIVLISEE